MILLIFIYLSLIKLRLIGYPLQIFNYVNKLASIRKKGVDEHHIVSNDIVKDTFLID